MPKRVREALEKALPQRIADMEALTTCGDVRVRLEATKYLIDRTLGRPAQAVEMSGPHGAPVRTEIVVRYVGHDD